MYYVSNIAKLSSISNNNLTKLNLALTELELGTTSASACMLCFCCFRKFGLSYFVKFGILGLVDLAYLL